MIASTLCTLSNDISSARSSPQSAAAPAPPFHDATQGAMPNGPRSSAETTVGIAATTVGGVGGFVVRLIVVKSKTTTEELPFATNKVLPSALTSRPSGPDIGFTPLAREAQHCAPGNPPK